MLNSIEFYKGRLCRFDWRVEEPMSRWMPFHCGYYDKRKDSYRYTRAPGPTTPDSFTIWQYTISGMGILEHKGRTYQAGPGQAMILLSNEAHTYYPSPKADNWEFIYFDLIGADAYEFWHGIQNAVGPVHSFDSQGDAVACGIDSIAAGFEQRYTDPCDLSALAYGFAMAVAKECPVYERSKRSTLEEKVRRFCLMHLAEEISVEEMARHVGLSRSHFTRKFCALVSESPAHYLLTIRMEHAKGLLEETDQTVKRIVRDTGFKETSYFCKVFRRAYGISPLDFRRLSRNV